MHWERILPARMQIFKVENRVERLAFELKIPPVSKDVEW
jgi:hypothetical protein